MTKDEVPSVNPKLDTMCEMLKTIHTLNERNKMLEAQKKKRNFRKRKVWKDFKAKKKKECGGLDLITLQKLGRRWELHHEDLNDANYEKLNDNFLPCNNMTHDFIHWLFRYYPKDPGIIDRIKAELEKMKAINQGGKNEDLHE